MFQKGTQLGAFDMKRFLALLFVTLAITWPLSATTLTGTIKKPDGTKLNGKIRLTLSHPARDTSDSTVVVPTTVELSVTNGTLPLTAAVAGNDVLQPANTYYICEYFDAYGKRVMANPFYIAGTTYDLGSATPTTVTTSNISYFAADTNLRTDLASSAGGKGDSLVATKQSGTGAVARTIHDKAGEIVSVKDYGATGNGAADDTAAIQAAVNSLSLTGIGDRIYFPKGTYKVTGTITIPRENVSLEGPVAGGAVIAHAPAAPSTDCIYIHKATGAALSEVHISNLLFTGTANSRYLIYSYNSQSLTVDRIRTNGGAYAIYLRDGYNIGISNSKFGAHTTANILLGEAVGGAYPTTVRIINCDVSDSALGLWIRHAPSVSVIGSTLEANTGYAIRIDSGTLGLFQCHFESNGVGNVDGRGTSAAQMATLTDIGSFHGAPTVPGPAYNLDYAYLQYFGYILPGVAVTVNTRPTYIGGTHDAPSLFTGEIQAIGWDGVGTDGSGSQFYGWNGGLVEPVYVRKASGPLFYAPSCRWGGVNVISGQTNPTITVGEPTDCMVGQVLTFVFYLSGGGTVSFDPTIYKTSWLQPSAVASYNSVTFVRTPQKYPDGSATGLAKWMQVGKEMGYDGTYHIYTNGTDSDTSGTVTITNPATSAIKTFKKSYDVAPSCSVTPMTDAGAGTRWWVDYPSYGDNFRINLSAAPGTSLSFKYICVGNPN
jgi:hypothetical protein